jgi:hypothetical protein
VIKDSTDSIVRYIYEIPVAGPTTNVPEFNDCQRFVIGDTAYDSLYAIFAAFHLERLPSMLKPVLSDTNGRLGRKPDTLSNADTTNSLTGGGATASSGVTSALSYAEIYSWGGTYAPLGIEPGFNCLYMFKESGRLRARMIPVASRDSACVQRITNPIAVTEGKELVVLSDPSNPMDGAADRDFPSVARWDWDAQNMKQYIGIKCDVANWCAVGDSDLVPSAQQAESPPADPIPNEAPSQAEQGRVFRIKGWYDSQRLAVLGQDGKPRPGRIWGRIFPHPMLGKHNARSSFRYPWVHVATVLVNGSYSGRAVHFRKGWNKIYLCTGSAEECHVTGLVQCADHGTGVWWAKIVPPKPWYWPFSKAYYRCVYQRDHSAQALAENYTIPAAARWRWLADDETTWERCTEGCCETRP